jgi:hypothetical protein
MFTTKARAVGLAAVVAASAGPGCGGGDDDGAGSEARYVVASVVFGPQGETSYLNVLASLEPQTIDYGRAVELPGWADVWVHEGRVFVSSGDAPTITRYAVGSDGTLTADGTLSFTSYGLIDAAFWSNTFVAPDKGYMINGTSEYVVWNPETMEITGTIPFPTIGEREGLIARAGTTDRSNVIRDGKLYQPLYWGDADYVLFAPDSKIAVFDIATDTALTVIDAPCPAPDVGTIDDAGNLYFSAWTGGVYGPLELEQPPNCVTRIAAGSMTADVAFGFAGVTDGREGAAARHIGGGRLLFPVFHHERVDFDSGEDPWVLIGEKNWRLWSYDRTTGAAAVVDSIDWNSGAAYLFPVDDRVHLLIPGTDYASSMVYALDDQAVATPLFETRGWATRLFALQ